jgi:hypothetical protein
MDLGLEHEACLLPGFGVQPRSWPNSTTVVVLGGSFVRVVIPAQWITCRVVPNEKSQVADDQRQGARACVPPSASQVPAGW